MVSYLGLILLELLLVFFGRQVYGLECGREPCFIQITASANATTSVGVEVAVSQLIESSRQMTPILISTLVVVISLVFDLHQDFN